MRNYLRIMFLTLPGGSLFVHYPRRRHRQRHHRAARSTGSAALHAVGLVIVAVAAFVALPAAARAQEGNPAVIESITKLNRNALEEYDNLNFDVARKILQEALDLCSKNGLNSHPIKARTLVHLGVVALAGGASAHDEAIKYFRDALAIEPNIKLSDRVANPEVQSAFNEAVAAVKESPPPATAPSAARAVVEPAPATPGLSHDAIASANKGSVIPVGVITDPSLGAKKVVLAYRPAGAAEYISRELKEYSTGNWSGSIPDTATTGDEVDYLISVANEGGQVVATQGSEAAPIVVKLRVARPVAIKKAADEEPEGPTRVPEAEKPTWFFGLGVGSGLGYATGKGDVNTDDKVTAGFGSSRLGHVLPEIGYFVSPDLVLSLQVRIQAVSGATPVTDPLKMMCGDDHVCDPASGALAAFARMTWLFGEGAFHPFLAAAVGAGQIRHLASFPSMADCGSDPTHPVKCVDTVAAGPILLGPGGGFIFNATSSFGIMAGVNSFLGFPQFTFHLDFNAGVVLEL
jgi:hypothetical protein